MNYSDHYNRLITRAKTRSLKVYSENHHVIPKCLGGTDENSNVVNLTPEEHYIAHLLLVKMYPNNHKLLQAAMMMRANRPSNKLYGWLRRKFSESCKKTRKGSGNTQYGTIWICNVLTKKNAKIKKTDCIPVGWVKGRSVWNAKPVCNLSVDEKKKIKALKISRTLKQKYANGTRKAAIVTDDMKKKLSQRQKGNLSLTGRIWITNGVNNKAIKKEEQLPTGWYKGKTYRSRGEVVSCVSSKHR